MESLTKVALKTGEIFEVSCVEFQYSEGVLYFVDSDEAVIMSIPQENVRYTWHAGKEITESPVVTPDPGPGYRLIDKAMEQPQDNDEIYIGGRSGWVNRECVDAFDQSSDCFYRRRVTPEPVCKREAFSGGGNPSPRECGVCGEGPCEKQPAQSPDDWVTQDRVPYRKTVDQCRWNVDLPGVWYEQQVGVHHMHGYKSGNLEFAIRCRRKDLPPLPVAIQVGDSVVITESPRREDSWNGCRRTVQAKVKNGYVVGKVGEPISRIYLERELRVIPKPDGE